MAACGSYEVFAHVRNVESQQAVDLLSKKLDRFLLRGNVVSREREFLLRGNSLSRDTTCRVSRGKLLDSQPAGVQGDIVGSNSVVFLMKFGVQARMCAKTGRFLQLFLMFDVVDLLQQLCEFEVERVWRVGVGGGGGARGDGGLVVGLGRRGDGGGDAKDGDDGAGKDGDVKDGEERPVGPGTVGLGLLLEQQWWICCSR